jgi:hypothetical protein
VEATSSKPISGTTKISPKCSSKLKISRSIHSEIAEKKLLELSKVGKCERSKNEKLYMKIEERVSRFYPCSYCIEALLLFFAFVLFGLGLWVTSPATSITGMAISQVLAAWQAHSQLHSRQPLV